jgi:predicted PurR-regulated permease PerM
MSEEIAVPVVSVKPNPPVAEPLLRPAYLRALLWVVVLVGAFWLLEHIKTTLTIFGIAFFIAYLLNSPVSGLERRGMKRGRAVALVYLLLLGTLGLAAALLLPLIIAQVDGLVTDLPKLSERLTHLSMTFREDYLTRIPEQYQAKLQVALAGSATYVASVATFLFTHLRSLVVDVASGALLIVTGLVVSIFVISQWRGLGENALSTVPRQYRRELVNLGGDLNHIFGGYMKATIMLSSSCGVATLVLLSLHGMIMGSNPYVLVIAGVTALCFPIPVINELVPPLLAGSLGFLSSDQSGYAVQVAAIVLFTIIIIERTLAPKIMSEAVGVSALFVLFAAFAGAELLGPIGALLGVPLAAMAKSVFVWFHARFLAAQKTEFVPLPVEVVQAPTIS